MTRTLLPALALLASVAPAVAEASRCKAGTSRCDTDRDGLNDAYEISIGTSMTRADTDSDGLGDGAEVNLHGTNPLRVDTDGDTLSDGAEVNVHGTSPLRADTDGDGLGDATELSGGTSPIVADTDGDGASDADDLFPLDPAEQEDLDGDGIGDNADLDDNDNGVADSREAIGVGSLTDEPGFWWAAELLHCPGSWDPPSHLNPACEVYLIDLGDDYTALGDGGAATGEWSEEADGARTIVRLAFPTFDTASQRVSGVQVNGTATRCVEGWSEALGGWWVVGGSSGTYWFADGTFSLCAL